jgi:hypothetical protein
MITLTIPINWDELKSKLKQKYPCLTEADLFSDDGKEEDMLRMVEYKLRKTTKEMQYLIRKL